MTGFMLGELVASRNRLRKIREQELNPEGIPESY